MHHAAYLFVGVSKYRFNCDEQGWSANKQLHLEQTKSLSVAYESKTTASKILLSIFKSPID